jgi:hypothetical protein
MTEFINILDKLQAPREKSSSLTRPAPSTGSLLSKTSQMGPAPELDFMAQEGHASPFASLEAAQKSEAEVQTRNGGDSTLVKQALAVDLGGQALSLMGGLQNIRAEEHDAMSQMAAEYKLAQEDLRGNTNIRHVAQASSNLRNTLARIRTVEAGRRGGGVQTQQFIRDPQTGALV